jgi:dihydroorotase
MVRTLPRELPRVFRLRSAVDDALLLRRVGDLARGLDAVVIVPSHDAALMRGAVAVEGATATRLGLPAVPEASETIGITRIVEVARLTGARFHIAGVFTGAGAALVEAHKALVTASVFASHLLVDEGALLSHRYDTRLLFRPPLSSSSSRLALLAAVKRGSLCISSGHHLVPKRERDLEMTRATPGLSSLSSLAALLTTTAEAALSPTLSPTLSTAELQTALSTLPARVLGLAPAPPLTVPTAGDDDLHRLLLNRGIRQ